MVDILSKMNTVFGPIYGKPCWQVKRGYGSFLTMEFGEPHLETREPMPARGEVSPPVQKLRAKRRVYVSGEWSLSLLHCDWFVFKDEKLIGGSKNKDTIASAANDLDGQKLLSVKLNPLEGSSRFYFDLDSRFETKPYDEEGEQWWLREPSGHFFVYRFDGWYSHDPGDLEESKTEWRRFS